MGHSQLVLLVVFLVVIEMLLAKKSNLGSDRAKILELMKEMSGRTLQWNVSQQSPYGWAEVLCEKNRVVGLRLLGCSLTGEIPARIIGNLTELHVLSLRNALQGPLPSDLGSCADLRNLYLYGNAFSGEIPTSLFSLTNLVRLNLVANNLSNEISTSFNKLDLGIQWQRRLMWLWLETEVRREIRPTAGPKKGALRECIEGVRFRGFVESNTTKQIFKTGVSLFYAETGPLFQPPNTHYSIIRKQKNNSRKIFF